VTVIPAPARTLDPRRPIWFEVGLVAITGVLVGAFPEAGVVAACVCAAWGLWRFRLSAWSSPRDMLILAFVLCRLVYALRTGGSLWLVGLEAVLMLVLPRAAWVLRPAYGRVFGVAALLGLMVPVGVAVTQVWHPDTQTWIQDPSRFREERLGEVRRFIAVDAVSAWAVQSLGVHGPGEVRYKLDLRANRPVTLKLSLVHPSLKGGREVVICQPDTRWTTCEIKANLPSSQRLDFVLGGFGLWKKGMSDLEVRSQTFQSTADSSIVNKLRFVHRQKSLAFNENAFGAWVAVISLLALGAIRDLRVTLLLVLPMLFGVYLSGSRGVMIAGVFGALVLIVQQFRVLKVLYWPLVIVVSCGLFLQMSLVVLSSAPVVDVIPSGFRAFDINDTNSSRSRLEIWRGALQDAMLEPVVGPGFLRASAQQEAVRKNAFDALPHAHNVWIQMIVEGGVLQLAVLMGLLFLMFFRLRPGSDDGWFAVVCAILFINNTDFIFDYAPVRLCFWFILGTVTAVRSRPVKI
jgi:hypothetical protein